MARTTFPMFTRPDPDEPIVITGIGLITALGNDRESTWQGIQRGECAIDWIRGLRGIPDESMFGAQIQLPESDECPTELKALQFGRRATREAIADAAIDWSIVDPARTGCAISGHMGDTRGIEIHCSDLVVSEEDPFPWWSQIMPNSACSTIAREWGLNGPRLCHSTACASGLISLLTAVRSIHDGQCDIAIAGGGECINPLFAAGFRNMRALATGDDPSQACLPFDINRKGFVMGEGAAVFVVERLSHALKRNAKIYCSINRGAMVGEAHHMTGLDTQSEALVYLINQALRQSGLDAEDIGYINAHGTGTQQNDAAEISGIGQVFQECIEQIHVSATKSMIGHLVKAAGCAELAITILGLRDGVCPPTMGLENLEPDCPFDCVAHQSAPSRFQHALKLSLAFGGHLVGVTVSRWNDAQSAFAYPERTEAA
jgi:3-oxoacyl-(acyl-carrier-protein) synthase